MAEALIVVFHDAGLDRPSYWPPSAADVQRAWAVLEEPVASYIKALIKLGRTYPPKRPDQSYDGWLGELEAKAASDYEPVIDAIVRGAEVVATARVTAALADRARLKGATYLDLSDQGDVERKVHVHVRGDEKRALFLRCWQVAGQPLQLLDHYEGATLALATIDSSAWQIKEGWLVPAGRRGRKAGTPGDDGGLPQTKEEPPKPKPTI